MSITESFYTYLTTATTINTAIGSTSGIFPGDIPQNYTAYPAIAYSVQDDEDIQLLDGGISDTHIARIECRIFSASVKTTNDIAGLLKIAMRYQGPFGAHTADHIRKDGEISLPLEPETGLHGVRLIFEISYY